MTSSSTPLISVIIPVYNAEKYIGVCLDSMMKQTMQAVEILCVNDGSTDNTLNILNEYAAKDSRIKVITQKNARSAAARNKGLEEAQGTYIMFCDSDDLYAPETCQTMYDCMVNKNVDFAMYNTLVKYSDGKTIQPPHYFPFAEGRYELDDDIKFRTNIYVWNKIFKKSLIDEYGMRYPVGHQSDDDAFVYQYLMVAKTAYFLKKDFYTRLMHEDSIMGAYWGTGTKYPLVQDHIDISEFVYDYAIRNNIFEQNKEYFARFFFNELFYSWIYVQNGWEDRYLTRCIEVVSKTGISTWSNKPDEQQIFDALLQNDQAKATKALDFIIKKRGKSRRLYIGKDSITPVNPEKNVAIAFVCNNHTVHFVAVSIKALIQNLSPDVSYEIHLFTCGNFSFSHQEQLNSLVNGTHSVTLKFINLSDQLASYEELRNLHLTSDSPYLRFILPQFFAKFSNLIVLDPGVVVDGNILHLLDPALLKGQNLTTTVPSAELVIFDVPKYLESGAIRTLLNSVDEETLQTPDDPDLSALGIPVSQLPDQHYIHFQTNYPSLSQICRTTVISYPAPVPLHRQDFGSFVSYWWALAKQTPYYEEILCSVVHAIEEEHVKMRWAVQHLSQIRWKKLRYAFKCRFASKNKKQKYKQRYQELKSFYSNVKRYKKSHLTF